MDVVRHADLHRPPGRAADTEYYKANGLIVFHNISYSDDPLDPTRFDSIETIIIQDATTKLDLFSFQGIDSVKKTIDELVDGYIQDVNLGPGSNLDVNGQGSVDLNSGNGTLVVTVTPVPEPYAAVLLGAGTIVMYGFGRMRMRKAG